MDKNKLAQIQEEVWSMSKQDIPRAVYHIYNDEKHIFFPAWVDTTLPGMKGMKYTPPGDFPKGKFTRNGKLYVYDINENEVTISGILRVVPSYGRREEFDLKIIVDLNKDKIVYPASFRAALEHNVKKGTGLTLPTSVFQNYMDMVLFINTYNELLQKEE